VKNSGRHDFICDKAKPPVNRNSPTDLSRRKGDSAMKSLAALILLCLSSNASAHLALNETLSFDYVSNDGQIY